ncbi:protein Fmp27p, mitochondrial [[Candida] anglica]|uniref:Protein Fmp27p, mitochondrial n=1 Tax=[Candida] anglica TaxID=148631 RepID=A0ABP0EPS9_9ASCO
MFPIEKLVQAVTSILVLWIVGWYAFYLTTGFHLKSIGINNGISFNGISFNSRKIEISIRSFRFRLWGNTRKIIIDELHINVKNRGTNSDQTRTNKGKKKKKTTNGSDDQDRLTIIPSSGIFAKVIRFALSRIPLIDIQIRNSHITTPNGKTSLDYVKFSMSSRHSERFSDTIKFNSIIILNNVSVSLNQKQDTKSPLSTETLKIQCHWQVNLNDGSVYRIKTKVFIDHLRVSLFSLVKHYLQEVTSQTDIQSNNKEGAQTKPTVEDSESPLSKLQRLHRKLYGGIEEVSVHVENTAILEIPFANPHAQESIEEYFNKKSPTAATELRTKSISVNYSRLHPQSPGFQVLFDPVRDTPFHIISSVQLLTVNYTTLFELEKRVVKRTDEVLNLPNFGCTIKSNVLDHLARGDGFKNCVIELFSSASSPIVDLDTEQLTSFNYNIVLIVKYLKLLKGNRKFMHGQGTSHDESSDKYDDDDSELQSDDTIVSKEYEYDNESITIEYTESRNQTLASETPENHLLKLLYDYYPKVEVKLVVEQPRFIIRHTNDVTDSTQLLNFSYSYLNLHVLTNSTREYDCNCNFLHPAINYIEKSNTKSNKIIQSEIFGIESLDVKVDVLRNFRVKPSVYISNVNVDLSELDVIHGMSNLLQEINFMVDQNLTKGFLNVQLNEKLREYFRKRPRQIRRPELNLEDKVFKNLPHWLLQTDINVSKISLKLGSRSPFMKPEELSQFNKGSDKDLRTMTISLVKLHVYIANESQNKSFRFEMQNQTMNAGKSEITKSFLPYWAVAIKLEHFGVSIQNNNETDGTFLAIPSLSLDLIAAKINEKNKLIVNNDIGDISGFYDRYKLFVLLGSVNMVKEVILTPIKMMGERWKKDKRIISREDSFKPEYDVHPKDFIYVDSNVSKIELEVELSDDFKIKVQTFDINAFFSDGIITLTNKLSRLLADSPTVSQCWTRVLCLDSLKVVVNDPSLSCPVDVTVESIRILHPHQFVVYHLFDNLAITVKIAKHLFQTLKGDNNRDSIVVPTESKALDVPNIRLRTRKIFFAMEDDPFEAELAMIYQLGLVEQRKRLEQLSLFENKAKSTGIDKQEYANLKETLEETISKSWIRKVKVFKGMLSEEIIKNKKYLFGSEATLPPQLNEGIVSYMIQAPLFSAILESLDVNISSTKFSLDELPQFLYDIGQGVPKDTVYSLMLPTYIDLKLGELRLHLRDYPLPLLHVPANIDKSPSLAMHGHLIISENLVTAKEHVRRLEIPLVPGSIDFSKLGYNGMIIEKALSTVKLYSDLRISFSSEQSTRFVWGSSYQFALQQTILNFDQFSKPPVDPSEKLGVWDKLKYVMHGNFNISVKGESDLQIAIKGSRDPYNLFGSSSGFVLAFRDQVEWKINEHDDPRSFFEIIADKVSFFIPNYLAAPLIAWTRQSSKSTYLPTSQNFVSTAYAYYLEDIPTPTRQESLLLNRDVLEKTVLKLSGGINFKLGFLFQRDGADGKKTYDAKPHYEVELYNPEYTEEGHDSYSGFRSDYIHMAISLTSNNEGCNNAIHLSPGVFKQLFSWWVLFSGNMMLPIRRGPLFGDLKEDKKFSQHLYTNKFLFDFSDVFISHIYRDETVDGDKDIIECIGVRGKMQHFVLDLHQRKEHQIEVHEGLDRKKKIKKMNFNIGESHLKGIDLRAVHSRFDHDIYSKVDEKYDDKDSTYWTFDGNSSWFDIDDYEEAYIPALKKNRRDVKIYPLMYTECFSYFRDTSKESELDSPELGNEDSHNCKIHSENMFESLLTLYRTRITQLEKQIKKNQRKGKPTEQLQARIESLEANIKEQVDVKSHKGENISDLFHNRFMLISMMLKWNIENRNLLLKYIQFVQWKSYITKYLSYDSIRTLQDIIDKRKDIAPGDIETIQTELNECMNRQQMLDNENLNKDESSEERLGKFDEILRRVADGNTVTEDFLIEIISPQIQLQSSEAPDSVVLVAAPNIDVKILSVVEQGKSNVSNIVALENRYGVLMRDANIFVLNKDMVASHDLILAQKPYGSKENWPPWLGIEICKNGTLAGYDNLLVEKTSTMVTFEHVKPLGHKQDESENDAKSIQPNVKSSSDSANRVLRIDVPKFVVTSTAKQYSTLYIIVISLLFYSEPLSKNLTDKLEKLKFSIDFQDLNALQGRLINLHKYYQLLDKLTQNYQFKQHVLDNEDLNNHLSLNLEKGSTALEIYLMMQSILGGDLEHQVGDTKAMSHWTIRADQIILHLLEDDRTPILDVGMARGICQRTINDDGSNINRIEIFMMQGFNLLKTARYPELFAPFEMDVNDDSENVIVVDWTMNRPIGGIKIIEDFQVNAKPLKIKIDDITGEKLLEYIFQSDGDINESPLIALAEKHTKENNGDDVDNEDNDECDSEPELDGVHVEMLEGTNKQPSEGERSSSLNTSKASQAGESKLSKRLNNVHFATDSSSSEFNSEHGNDVEEMVSRSKKYMSIGALVVQSLRVSVSIKCHKGFLRVLNVEDFVIDLPEFAIHSEVVSVLDITMLMQKFFIKALLSHTGRLLKNKFQVRKDKGKNMIKRPLRPVKKYVNFTSVAELRGVPSVSPSANQEVSLI